MKCNIVHIVSEKYKGLDENTNNILIKENLKVSQHLFVEKMETLNYDKRKIFLLCLSTAISSRIVKQNLTELFQNLKNHSSQIRISTSNVSKEIDIKNITWPGVEEIINNTSIGTNIKIIVCMHHVEFINNLDLKLKFLKHIVPLNSDAIQGSIKPANQGSINNANFIGKI